MALIVGTVIGAGIFRTPSLVAANAGTEQVALLAWLAGGAVSLVGALCYAELATAYPHTGGDYHYIRRAFGRRLAFLFAWARMSVIQTGSIALLAFIAGDYASNFAPLGVHSSAVYAALIVVLVTAVNVVGVRQGKFTQNVLTSAVLLGLLVVVVAGLLLGGRSAPAATALPSTSGSPAFGLVMVFVLLTYGGWNEAAYVSAEVRNPRRNMARALVWSLLLVTAVYLLVNWAYVQRLGLAGMAQSRAVASDLMQQSIGEVGAAFVSLLIIVSALTSANAAVFTGARSAWALGRDVKPLAALGRWDRAARSPVNALCLQGAVAIALITLGALTRQGFETMVEYTAPVFWLFFLLTGLSLFVLRRRDPATPRPFPVPLYPLTPLVFCATSVYLLYSSLVYTGVGALFGLAVLAAGALVLALVRRNDVEGGL
jgi:amino acid transporter